MKSFTLWLALVSTFTLSNAQPVFSPVTGSYYEVVTGHGTWSSARDAAAAATYLGLSGRLATVTSQAENDFLLNNVLGSSGSTYWLGAFQPNGANVAPDAGWEWITGEPWAFTNWRRAGGSEDEPNDFGGGEHCLEMFDFSYGQFSGTWNDLAENNTALSEGYLIEYAPVPEPTSIALVGLGVVTLFARRTIIAARRSQS